VALMQGGKRVQMKYVGRLASNGKVFDQTKGNKPFTFRLGVGEVIKVRFPLLPSHNSARHCRWRRGRLDLLAAKLEYACSPPAAATVSLQSVFCRISTGRCEPATWERTFPSSCGA
jgi:hypothetical protein